MEVFTRVFIVNFLSVSNRSVKLHLYAKPGVTVKDMEVSASSILHPATTRKRTCNSSGKPIGHAHRRTPHWRPQLHDCQSGRDNRSDNPCPFSPDRSGNHRHRPAATTAKSL